MRDRSFSSDIHFIENEITSGQLYGFHIFVTFCLQRKLNLCNGIFFIALLRIWVRLQRFQSVPRY